VQFEAGDKLIELHTVFLLIRKWRQLPDFITRADIRS
jgi:hypothetical protein